MMDESELPDDEDVWMKVAHDKDGIKIWVQRIGWRPLEDWRERLLDAEDERAIFEALSKAFETFREKRFGFPESHFKHDDDEVFE